MLSGVLNETSVGTRNAATLDSNNDSESDEGSTCDVKDSAFNFVPGTEDEADHDNEADVNFLGDGWEWNKWEEIGDDDEIPGPVETDHYNGPHGLKDGVGGSFHTILQCIFKTTCMDRDFFKRLSAQTNTYAQADMMKRNSSLYLGHKRRI